MADIFISYGSGVMTGMEIILQIQLPILKDLTKVENVCCAAVHGNSTRGAYVRPIASGSILTLPAASSVFELPGIYDYALNDRFQVWGSALRASTPQAEFQVQRFQLSGTAYN
jgi:hypothetical protein